MTRLNSWVASANTETTDFPLNNLPYGVFSVEGGEVYCGAAIGDMILNVSLLEEDGLIKTGEDPVFDLPFWNEFMELGPDVWASLRARLTDLLSAGGEDTLRSNPDLQVKYLTAQADAEMHMPLVVAEFTDFYSGRHHATNVGTMFRGAENALPPNWLHLPIGYNGRASTVVVSGTDIRRPLGQLKPPTMAEPYFGPSKRLDIELEMGVIIGTGNTMGEPITLQQADDMIFGYVLLNDWSARDIQAWEYQPLGPFNAKSFGTSISPWIITKAALEPFRTNTPAPEKELLPYLKPSMPLAYNVDLTVTIQPKDAVKATTITTTNYNELYYAPAQQLCHHAIGGCEMSVGDLLGSGTISGPEKHNRGSLLEISWGGKEPFILDTGETRTFLKDGDTVTLSGHAQAPDHRIGFGTCTGTIVPAHKTPT